MKEKVTHRSLQSVEIARALDDVHTEKSEVTTA